MKRPNRISNNKKRKVKALLEQVAQALATGQGRKFELLCEQVEQLWPNNPDVANLRGIAAAERGDQKQAEMMFVQAANSVPNRVAFRNNLAQLYLKQHLYKDAADVYGQATTIDPESVEAQAGFGLALFKLGYLAQAKEILSKAKKKFPAHADVLLNLFLLSRESGAPFEDSLALIDALLDAFPDHAEGRSYKGQLLMERGDFKAAEVEIRRALHVDSTLLHAIQALVKVKRFEIEDDDVRHVQSVYDATEPGTPARVHMSFAMGQVMEGLKQYDRAFAYYKEGNDLRHRHSTYSTDTELAHMQQIMQYYTGEVCANTSGIEDETAVFIVGMPRCGSTLTEQILAAHPDVASKGESNAFVTDALLGFHSEEDELTLEKITSFSPDEWHEMGSRFVKGLRGAEPSARRITDKTLNSIRFVGAIHCALPKARIIHVRRNPLDTCLSIYKSHFKGGVFDYQFNLGEIAYYYRMYQQLMQHWREVLPTGVMYELDYELLVENQEAETRKLLDYCGLEWNEACLNFNQAKNVVQTTSIMQVRRPIYRDSLAAWKRYEQHIQPLIKILGVT